MIEAHVPYRAEHGVDVAVRQAPLDLERFLQAADHRRATQRLAESLGSVGSSA